MAGMLDAALANPWGVLDSVLDGPLHPGGREATDRLLDGASVGPETRLLDVGCGAGDGLDVARERGADAIGLDAAATADCTVRGDATAVPVQDGQIDVVLAECVLCLTDLPVALEEIRRVLAPDGRVALSDVVVEDDVPAIPDPVAEALCLTGARSRDALTAQVGAAGFDVDVVEDHHDELLAMRDRVTDRVDYEGLLGLMGERGQRTLDAIQDLDAAVESGRVSYVSVVATA